MQDGSVRFKEYDDVLKKSVRFSEYDDVVSEEKKAPYVGQFPEQVVTMKPEEITNKKAREAYAKSIPQPESLSTTNAGADAYHDAVRIVNATDKGMQAIDNILSGKIGVTPLSVTRASYEGLKGGVEKAAEAGQLIGKGDVALGAAKTINAAVGTVFAGLTPFVPALQGFTAVSQLGEQIAPEITQAAMQPVTSIVKPETELGKELTGIGDVAAQFVMAYGAKGGKKLYNTLKEKYGAEIPIPVIEQVKNGINEAIALKQSKTVKPLIPEENVQSLPEKPITEQKPLKTEEVAEPPKSEVKTEVKPVEEATAQSTDKGQLDLTQRFISDDSYQLARKGLREKGMQFNVGIDPTMLKDLTVVGAYHLENIARAGIEKGKEFAEFSKRMIAELGQEVKPHLLKIYNSTVKEHQKTLEELRTLPKGTKGQPDLHFGGVDERIKPEVQEFYDTHKAEYDQFRGGKIGNKQLINQGLKYASKLTDEDILSMKSRKGVGEVEFVGSHIYGQHRIEQLVKEMDAVDISVPEGLAAQKAKVDLMAGIFNNIELPKTTSGRILQISGKLATDNFIDALRKLRDSAEKYDPELAKDLANKLRGAEYEPTLKDKLAFWYYNSLLSDPTTDIRNITGNTTMLVSEVLSKSFSPNIKETLKMMGDIGRGVKSGGKEVSDIYSQRVAEDSKFINTVNKYDVKATTAWGKFGRALLPTTRLSMEDAFFRGIAREMSKGKVERATAKTFGESLEKTRQQIEKVDNGDLDNLSDAQIKFMSKGLDYIENYTDYTTFRTPLGKIASGIEGIVRDSWAAKIIMPFVKIGANIIKAGTDYSPLGFGKEVMMRLRGQEINPFELKDIRRRAIAGTLAIGVVANGVANGTIEVTGQLPSDAFEREAMQAKGYQPNHIYLNFGGKKVGVSYQNINPVNIPLSIIGNYSDNLRFGKDIKKQDELSFGDKMGKAILGSAATIADQSYMQGINNLLDAMQKQDPGYFSDIAVGFVPNIVGLPKKVAGDNISYKAKTLEEKVQRKIGLTEGLEPNIDIRGEEKKTQLRGLPLPVSEIKEDKLLDYLKEKDLRIPLPSAKTKLDEEKLTPNQYTQYQKAINKNVYNKLTKILPLLKKMTAEKAQDLIDKISNEEKQKTKTLLRVKSSRRTK